MTFIHETKTRDVNREVLSGDRRNIISMIVALVLLLVLVKGDYKSLAVNTLGLVLMVGVVEYLFALTVIVEYLPCLKSEKKTILKEALQAHLDGKSTSTCGDRCNCSAQIPAWQTSLATVIIIASIVVSQMTQKGTQGIHAPSTIVWQVACVCVMVTAFYFTVGLHQERLIVRKTIEERCCMYLTEGASVFDTPVGRTRIEESIKKLEKEAADGDETEKQNNAVVIRRATGFVMILLLLPTFASYVLNLRFRSESVKDVVKSCFTLTMTALLAEFTFMTQVISKLDLMSVQRVQSGKTPSEEE